MSSSLEFGIFHEFPSLPGRSDADAFDQGMALVDDAERWGLDVMWLAELHFDPARAVLSAPLVVASAIAMRTTRMKIGLAVQVLPLAPPLRLAEEAATVDQLSKGRLIFGVGRSGVARTYEAYGIPYAESKDRFNESLEVIQKAWTNERVAHKGRFYQFDEVVVVPKPYQQPMPPIRIAAASTDTFAAIGTLGFPIFIAVRYELAEEIQPWLDVYRDAWKAAGHPGNGEVHLRVPGYIAETDARAHDEPRESLMHFYAAQAKLLGDSVTRLKLPPTDRRAKTVARLTTMTYEQALAGTILVGGPEKVAARLAGLRDQLGLSGVMLELNPGGRIPHENVRTALRLLCQDVMPRFR